MPRPKNELTKAEADALLGKKAPVEERKSKYNNKKTVVKTFFGDHTFDSIRESEEYVRLDILRRKGLVVLLLCQVPFRLPGKTKYVADFFVRYADGTWRVIDVKGMKTAMYQLKKRQVQEIYGINIVEVE